MMHSPDGHPVCGLAMCYNGPVDEGERAIKAIRDFETPIAGAVGPMPYTASAVDARRRIPGGSSGALALGVPRVDPGRS